MDFIYNPFGFIRDLLYGAFVGFMPEWLASAILSLLGIAILFGFIPTVVMALVYLERKVIARMQDRIGPNRVGPFGILQPVADALKLLTKEDIIPAGAIILEEFVERFGVTESWVRRTLKRLGISRSWTATVAHPLSKFHDPEYRTAVSRRVKAQAAARAEQRRQIGRAHV